MNSPRVISEIGTVVQHAIFAALNAGADPPDIRQHPSERADLIAEAAALCESLSQNHPFVDGNKRTAPAVAYTLLAINGIRMTAGADDLWAFFDHHYSAGTFSFDVLDAWLRENAEPQG